MPNVGRMGKILRYAVCSAFAFLTLTLSSASAAEEKEGIDALLLIDISGSMQESDSSRNAIEATKMFIDMLETSNSRVGIIGFNESLTGAVDITEIESVEDKENLKRMVDGFNYAGWTDIGLSLKEAVGIMSRNMRSTNSPMVLLLTDGKIELGENSERTVEESYDDVIDAISAEEKNLPVYTIGLNYDGSVDRQFLRTISENTDGRSYIITEAHDLPQIFNEIFADHIRSRLIEVATFTAGDGYTDVNINVDSDFVAEANIIMLSEEGILDARIFDPDGNESVFDQETITFSNSRKYSIIKILFPKKGDWLLQVQGVEGDQVRVNLIYQYNIDVELEVTQAEAIGRLFDPQSPVDISGHILVNGEAVADDSLYLATASSAIVTDMEGSLLFKVPLTATPEGLTGSFTPSSADPVAVYIETVSPSFTKESGEVVVQFELLPAERPAPPPSPAPETAEAQTEPQAGAVLGLYAAAAGLIVLLIAAAVFMMRRRKPRFFEGFLEIRAMNDAGVYTSVEAPSLHTYVGAIDLDRFLNDNMPKRVYAEIAALPFGVKNVMLSPSAAGNAPAILLENKSGSDAEGANGAALGKKYTWKPDETILIKGRGGDTDSPARLEMTYRVEEL